MEGQGMALRHLTVLALVGPVAVAAAEEGDASRTQYYPNYPYPGWIEEEVVGVVPGACTGTAEPELEVRRLPVADPRGAPWATRDAEPVAMAFADPRFGLMQSSGSGRLLYTRDAGRTWRSPGGAALTSPIDNTGVEIAFADTRTAWAIGWSGHGRGIADYWRWQAVVTFDGGLTWQSYVSGGDRMAQMLAGTTARRGRWRMPDGAAVVAYVSTDDGQIWSELPAPWSRAEAERNVRRYDRLVLFGEQQLFISASGIEFPVVEADWRALQDAIHRSFWVTSYGMSEQPSTDAHDPSRRWALPPESVDRGSGSPIRSLSLPPYLLRTEDGGGSWRRVPLVVPSAWWESEGLRGVWLTDILMVDDAHGWLEAELNYGDPGDWPAIYFCTADGGETWHRVDIEYMFHRRWHITYVLDYRHLWTATHFNIYRIAPTEPE